MVYKKNEDITSLARTVTCPGKQESQRTTVNVRADEEPAAVLSQTLYERNQTDVDSALCAYIPSLIMNLVEILGFLALALLSQRLHC